MCKIESTLFIALLFAINSCAQLAPANDANWQLVPALSDEFNGTSLGSLWRVLDTCNPPILLNNSEGIGAWGSHEQCQEDNTYLDGNNICFKLLPFQNPSLDVPCVPFRNVGHSQNYSSGGVISYGEYYEYGYFEMEAQLPGYFDANGSPSGYAFWPAFWTSSWEVVNSCYLRKFEIDILEPDGTINQYGSANRNVCGLWIVKPDNQCEAYKRIQSQVTSSQPLFTGFHKYAAEHLKDPSWE